MSRLHTVLRVRGIEERRRAGEAASAEHARVAAAEREDRTRARARAWQAPTGRSMGADALVGGHLHAVALQDQAEVATEATLVASSAHAAAQRAWSDARVRLRSVERLAEQRAEAARLASGRRAQAEADELALYAPTRRSVGR